MSLDISLVDAESGMVLCEHNITHNVIPMWRKAGVAFVLYESAGQPARNYIDTLGAGVRHMAEHFSEYQAIEPANKWGTANDALEWLFDLYRHFCLYPAAIIQSAP